MGVSSYDDERVIRQEKTGRRLYRREVNFKARDKV